MFLSFTVISATGALLPGRATASRLKHQSTSSTLSKKLSTALLGQDRIELRGEVRGPTSMVTKYLMRYQSGGREFLQETGGAWSHVVISGQKSPGVKAIYIGKQAFTSVDGKQWYRSERPAEPSPFDVLALNVANVPCC